MKNNKKIIISEEKKAEMAFRDKVTLPKEKGAIRKSLYKKRAARITLKDFPKIRKKYNISEEEYDDMLTFIGTWTINKKDNIKSFVFVSSQEDLFEGATNGTPKLIVITEDFLKKILKKYE